MTRSGEFGSNAPRLVLLLGAALGLTAFSWYYRAGLTVAHYDAKAHLVVARRILDSIEPGYVQMGVHWLPFAHLLYLPFVVFDAQYRTAFLPSLISVAAFALSGWLAYRIAFRLTRARPAGLVAAAILSTNPNLLYLQSCPLTEPLYMALSLFAFDGFLSWREKGERGLPWGSAVAASLSALCRYEGWFLVAAFVCWFAWRALTDRETRTARIRAGAVYAAVFALPLLLHFGYLYSKANDTFIHRVVLGNPAPYETYRRPFLSLMYHAAEIAQIAAVVPFLAGLVGFAWILAGRERLRRWGALAILWTPSLINIAALYWGLIYRVRYSVLLLPAIAVCAAVLTTSTNMTRRVLTLSAAVCCILPWISWLAPAEWKFVPFAAGPGQLIIPVLATLCAMAALAGSSRPWVFLLVLSVAAVHVPALRGELRAIMDETLEHAFIEPEREAVISHLQANYDGSRILIDMGRLAPLVYDTGLNTSEFVYNEGKQKAWRAAIANPGEGVGWVCTEIGDEVWNLLQVDPRWSAEYSLAVNSERMRLYRRISRQPGG